MEIDEPAVARWLEPLAPARGDIADVFIESRREIVVEWRDGEPGEARVSLVAGVAARRRQGDREHLAFVSGCDDTAVREAVRALQASAGRSGLPSRPAQPSPARADAGLDAGADRWVRRLGPIFSRHVPRHRFRWSFREVSRRVIAVGLPPAGFVRRLLSIEGLFTAASRRGDETRSFTFHAPESEGTADELKLALSLAASPREQPARLPDGVADIVFGNGTAAVLFHEILSHGLEADADSTPLAGLAQARVAVPELDVRDDPSRMDLFGGYEQDDEGTRPRTVKLLDAGRLGNRLTDRAHADARGSNGHGRRAGPGDGPLPRGSNTIVSGGQATTEEMTRRLSNGLRIEEIDAGTVELSSGQFRLRFPRARRVRRGRLADEVGPGLVAGEILPALSSVEPVIGREVRACRCLGWCSRGGHVLPVGGEAPDVLVRRLSIRALSK